MIAHSPAEEVAVFEDGRLCEYMRRTEDSSAEIICIGKVERIVKGMNAAFVDIGEKKNGFLPLQEKSQSFSSSQLQSGSPVLVQIKREAHGDKGAFLSRDITLCGTYVILMPMNRYVGISSQITGKRRDELAALGRKACGDTFGVVMRSAAENAQTQDILDEIAQLQEKWQTILKQSATAHVPSVLMGKGSLAEDIYRSYLARGGAERIVTDTAPDFECDCETAPLPADAFDYVHRELRGALQRKVPFQGGSNIVIDQCEAMTVVDVNTASFTGQQGIEATALQTNLAACREIVRQLRLRAISGIIIIDFIDMKSDEERHQVLQCLETELANDRTKCVVHGFTSLGLVEMTRKRSRKSLTEEMTAPCHHCGGTGKELSL